MKNKTVTIGTMQVAIPEYFQQVDSTPDDPPQSVPFMARSENAICFVLAYPMPQEYAMPLQSELVIDGIHECLGEDQGLIQADAGKDYVFSIVKTMKPEGGVQYVLTLDRYCGDEALHVQGFFDEDGATGLRDTTVYALCRGEGVVGSDDDPFYNWRRDPYDESYTDGALMNLSEQEKYDEMFPAHPLSMCRAFVRTVVSG